MEPSCTNLSLPRFASNRNGFEVPGHRKSDPSGLVRTTDSWAIVTAVKAGWLNVTLANYRNTDALDGVLGAARNTLLCPQCVPGPCDSLMIARRQ